MKGKKQNQDQAPPKSILKKRDAPEEAVNLKGKAQAANGHKKSAKPTKEEPKAKHVEEPVEYDDDELIDEDEDVVEEDEEDDEGWENEENFEGDLEDDEIEGDEDDGEGDEEEEEEEGELDELDLIEDEEEQGEYNDIDDYENGRHGGHDDDEEGHVDDEPLDVEQHVLESNRELLSMKINEILRTLADFKNKKDPNRSKVDYVIELRKYYCRYFSYSSELMEYLMEMFNPHECYNFLEMMDTSRPTTIRINTLKTKRKELAQALAEKNVNLEPLDEISKVCLKVNSSKVPIGATTEYLAGHYMLQSAASLLPVMALAPQPGEKVLDMAAAPGGKTTHIAQILKNTGLIVANDFKKERTKALYFNCQRMGIQNVIITNYDGRKFPDCLKNFDRILLDAPCTGLGIISRDQSIKANRTVADIHKASHLQKELLRAAIDRCKVGGYVVYSTCSIAVEENEEVVDYAVRQRHVKIVDTGLNIETKVFSKFKDKHFNDRMKYCVRVFPHTHNLDGFFICKLKKLKEGDKKEEYLSAQNSTEKAKPAQSKKNKLKKVKVN